MIDNNPVTYGSPEGPAYLNIKSNSRAQTIFNNFVRSVIGSDVRSWDDSSEYQKIKLALEEYNAVYRFNQAKSNYIRKHFIRFATPADATAFMLRFA